MAPSNLEMRMDRLILDIPSPGLGLAAAEAAGRLTTPTVLHGVGLGDPALRGAVVVLAQVDGLPLAQQALIAQARAEADRLGACLAVAAIERTPPVKPARLASLAQQARQLHRLGADLYVLGPHAELDLVAATLDSRTAAGRHGLAALIVAPDLTALASPDAAARQALAAGRPEVAARILGRPFALEGVVEEGQKLGRKLGFPTANISAGDYVRPRLGVYATRSRLADGRELPGVANFGVNPTTGLVDARLEVFLFDFDEDIYGQVLDTDLIAFLRPELKFDGLEPLILQIRQDTEAARALAGSPSFG